MSPQAHSARASLVLKSLRKLEPDDYEMRIEAAMLAGTQLLNACLHALGITADAEDVMHAEYMGGAARVKAQVIAPDLVSRLLEIEMLRPGYVRGDFDGGVQAGRQALQWLDSLQDQAAALGIFTKE